MTSPQFLPCKREVDHTILNWISKEMIQGLKHYTSDDIKGNDKMPKTLHLSLSIQPIVSV